MSRPVNLDELVQALTELRYGHLERRVCTAELPMAAADKDRYRWGHPDAVSEGAFFNLERFRCPNCGLTFTCLPDPDPSRSVPRH